MNDIENRLPIQSALALGCDELDPWLANAVSELAESTSWVDQVASVGMLARLWLPATADARVDLLSGKRPYPARAAREWFAGLSPGTIAKIEARAILATAELWELLDRVVESDEAIWSDELRRRRDAFESVALMLGRRSCLSRELATFDAEVSACSIAWSDEPWMSAVAAEDPLAWWGA